MATSLLILFIRGASVARADVDMTGLWMVLGEFSEDPVCMEFAQAGTSLGARFCGEFEDYIGTIDPSTGEFDISRPFFCTPGGRCYHLVGTATLDNTSFSATDTCSIQTPTGCPTVDVGLSGSRIECGDGILIAQAGEECDDGNTASGDCCSPTCQLDPYGTPCDDGNPMTTGEVCAAGICGDLDGEFRVNTFTLSAQAQPAVACHADGDFVVVWAGIFAAAGVSGRRYNSGGAPIGAQFQIDDFGRYPSVAATATGEFIVVWAENTDHFSLYPVNIFGRRYDSLGAPVGTAFAVDTYATASPGTQPDVSLNSGGEFVVTWTGFEQDGSDDGVLARRYASDGSAIGTEFVVNTYTTGYQRHPVVSLDDTGGFIVLWESIVFVSGAWDPDWSGVYARRYDSSGAPLGPQFVIKAGVPSYPDISVDATHRFVVTWASGFDVSGQRFDSTFSPLGTEFHIATTGMGAGFTSHPAVASDGPGNFVVTWRNDAGQDGSGFGVFGRRFTSTGMPAGTEFQVNVFTVSHQDSPDVCSDTDGDFAVVWTSDDEDGDDLGVFGRRFGQVTPAPSPTPTPTGPLPPSALEAYLCYQGRDLKDPRFTPVAVDMVDQFTSETVEVQKLKYVCVPAGTNGEPINDPATHLTCYQIKGQMLSTRPQVEVSTQFQKSQLKLKLPKLLCLPSTKTLLP